MLVNDKRCVFLVFTDSPNTGLGPCGWILVAVSFLFTVITFPISIWMCIKVKNTSLVSAKGPAPPYRTPRCVYLCRKERERPTGLNPFSFISALENSL